MNKQEPKSQQNGSGGRVRKGVIDFLGSLSHELLARLRITTQQMTAT